MDSLLVHVKTKDIYTDTAKDVDRIFDTSIYEVHRPLSIGRHNKVIGLMNKKLGGIVCCVKMKSV